MNLKNNVVIIFLIIIISSILIFILGVNYINQKESELLEKKYKNISRSFQEKIDVLIKQKRNATLALTLTLANDNKSIKDIILKNKNYNLEEMSTTLKRYTDFKNVWFQIIDKDGVSLYRSWSDKKNDEIYKFRKDISSILLNPKPKTSISIGIYDMTFKAMVPIFEENKFIGFIETITHFNSIIESLRTLDNVKSLIIVDKEYSKQLYGNSFSKTFIQNHYVANKNVDKELINYISQDRINSFLNIYNYKIKDDYLIINKPIFSADKKLANFLVFKKLNSISMNDVQDFKYHAFFYFITFLILIILILFSIFYYFYSKKLKMLTVKLNKNKKKLQELNENLQLTIKDEVSKNEQKNKLLFHQNKMAAMGEMVENIAHQWRQPLSLITTEASSIKVRKDHNLLDDESLEKSVQSILETSNYLSHTIDDFRHYFSPTKNKNFFNSTKLIDKSISLIQNELSRFNIQVIKDVQDLEISGYENELMQIIINLINNAKDELSTVNKTENRFIFIKLIVENELIQLTIKDTAGGIDEEIIDRIFEPYFTTKHKSKGTGIGLYMCEQIMNRHIKGTIKVKNERFKYQNEDFTGAVFLLSFPIK